MVRDVAASHISDHAHSPSQNTVDVIFPAYPAFLYTNPDLAKYLLLPLFEYQATGQYPNKWAVHDMGAILLRDVFSGIHVLTFLQAPRIPRRSGTMMAMMSQCLSKVRSDPLELMAI